MPKFIVSGQMTVSCWTEVEADTAEEARSIAAQRAVADVLIDGGYQVDECWHLDNDGMPSIESVEFESGVATDVGGRHG